VSFSDDPAFHIRPVQLKRDLHAIADLIELCFAPYLDAEGRDYIRHIRTAPRDYASYMLENSTPESSYLPFHGYVWLEGERIVGNLTLIFIRRYLKHAYFVANVAVHPDYRGRGIARKLTDRAIEHVRQHKGSAIYLQVREENTVAQSLYLSHGFEEITRRTQWVFRPGKPAPMDASAAVKVLARKKGDWPQQKDWLSALYPTELAWNFPVQIEALEPSLFNDLNNFLNGVMQRSWSAYENGRLIGAATLVRRGEPLDHIWLGTSPAWEERAIAALLPEVQRRTLAPHRLTVNYPQGRAAEAFRAAGMSELHTLIWMKRTMESLL
jgi:ribosomal protein S18 acetylase RimI-like enzyme